VHAGAQRAEEPTHRGLPAGSVTTTLRTGHARGAEHGGHSQSRASSLFPVGAPHALLLRRPDALFCSSTRSTAVPSASRFLQLLDPFLDGRRRRFGTFAFSTGHPLRETFPVGLRPLAVLLRERVELVVERHSPLLEFADAAVEVGYVGPPVPPEGEAPMYAALLGGEVAHDRAMMEAEQAADLAKILCETESAEPPTAAGTTSGGDEARLRGLPAIGRGVSGAIPGTSPVGAVMRKEKKRRRR